MPEWLNSPLWSTPPLASTPADPFGTDFSPPPAPSPKPSPSVPPPPMREQAVDSYAGREGEIREEDGAGAALRAHLLADFKAAVGVRVSVSVLGPAVHVGLICVWVLIVLPFLCASVDAAV